MRPSGRLSRRLLVRLICVRPLSKWRLELKGLGPGVAGEGCAWRACVVGFSGWRRGWRVKSVARSALSRPWSRPNKRMHATRDTQAVINLHRAGGRVMRGVGLLLV